jgi:hypothetical protein
MQAEQQHDAAALPMHATRLATEPNANEPLLKPKDAAALLNISERHLWSLSQPRGPIAVVRLGESVRYDPADLRLAIETLKAVPASRRRAKLA